VFLLQGKGEVTPRRNFAMVPEDDHLWQRFWNAYPKRVSKKDARAAWLEVAPTATDVALMEAALLWHAQQPSWLRDDGQYIPYPASWLRAERWTDEAPASLRPRVEWNCQHVEHCSHRSMCAVKDLNPAKWPLKESA
jgi:hypothetical protein